MFSLMIYSLMMIDDNILGSSSITEIPDNGLMDRVWYNKLPSSNKFFFF